MFQDGDNLLAIYSITIFRYWESPGDGSRHCKSSKGGSFSRPTWMWNSHLPMCVSLFNKPVSFAVPCDLAESKNCELARLPEYCELLKMIVYWTFFHLKTQSYFFGTSFIEPSIKVWSKSSRLELVLHSAPLHLLQARSVPDIFILFAATKKLENLGAPPETSPFPPSSQSFCSGSPTGRTHGPGPSPLLKAMPSDLRLVGLRPGRHVFRRSAHSDEL